MINRIVEAFSAAAPMDNPNRPPAIPIGTNMTWRFVKNVSATSATTGSSRHPAAPHLSQSYQHPTPLTHPRRKITDKPAHIIAEVGVTKAFPLGRWVHQQRRAYRAGELDDHRKKQLDAEGMVWEPGDEAWETKLAALRSYHRHHGHLAPRQDAVWGEEDNDLVPVGQLIANLRRRGGLGKDAEQAEHRAVQLAAVDKDWACPWPLDWQRHYRVLADGVLPAIEPGVLFEGDDLGKWLAQQRKPHTWAQLTDEQQERLTKLGVQPAQAPSPTPAASPTAKQSSKAQQAFQRGLAALAQWVEREGTARPVPHGHSETITVDGETEPVIVKLGVWISNTKSRRDKLTAAQLTALAELGIHWAQ